MAEDAVTIFICVTPSYDHWLARSVSAITTAKAQTYYPVDVSIIKFDDGEKVWDMFQQALDICETPYYAIIGADDFIGPSYIEESMRGIDDGDVIAAGSTRSWLISDEKCENEQIGTYDGWVSGVWDAEIARNLGGYRKPDHGGDHGCAALLAEKACQSGFKCAMSEARQYYYRIWSGSVSKPDPSIEEKIRRRKPGVMLELV